MLYARSSSLCSSSSLNRIGAETTKPLFLVVDKRSASASEVLSAALKENGRARLVGEKTFGKVGR